jgi:hypothetical protein
MITKIRITSVQVIHGRPRHKLFFGWGTGLSMSCDDRYITWLRNKWLNIPKRVDPSTLTTTEWDVEKNRKALAINAPRPRHPSRRSATGGQNY